MKNQTVQFQDIIITDNKLGQGLTATVYKGINKKTQENYAIKVVDLKQIQSIGINLIEREIELQQQFHHPNIIELLATHKDNKNLYLITEFADNGALWDKLIKNQLSKTQLKQCYRQIVDAVCYIHSKKTIHRDIKPENILLDKNFNAKLCDFGFSANIGDNVKRKTICGTTDYYPPEILDGKIQNEKVDIWCLGILFYELLHNKTPFSQLSMMRSFDPSKIVKFESHVTEIEKDIIRNCLRKNPDERISCEEILKRLDSQQQKIVEKPKIIQIEELQNKNNTSINNGQQQTLNKFLQNFNQKILLNQSQENHQHLKILNPQSFVKKKVIQQPQIQQLKQKVIRVQSRDLKKDEKQQKVISQLFTSYRNSNLKVNIKRNMSNNPTYVQRNSCQPQKNLFYISPQDFQSKKKFIEIKNENEQKKQPIQVRMKSNDKQTNMKRYYSQDNFFKRDQSVGRNFPLKNIFPPQQISFHQQQNYMDKKIFKLQIIQMIYYLKNLIKIIF